MDSKEASVPEIENVNVSPSPSVAVRVPTFVTFSAILNAAGDVNTGGSCTSKTFTVKLFVVVNAPSETATLMEYDDFVA